MTRYPSYEVTSWLGGAREVASSGLELSPAAVTRLHRFVARRVANGSDAADIAQQAIVLAWTDIGSSPGNLSGWLLAIARHLIVDHYRSQRRFEFVDLDSALVESEPELQTRPDAALAMMECRERLNRLLDRIARKICLEQQVSVLLSDVYGYADRESAELLHMSVPCFKLLLHGARARLRQFARRTAGAGARTNGCLGSVPSKQGLGIICRLGRPELLEMRRKLLQGLSP